jgi:hypothetical protein
MSIAKHVDAGRFHNLQKILSAWVRLNQQYCVSIPNDTPWSYNERASLSVLAAAVWNAGGEALEEYSTRKGRGQLNRTGRCDVYCHIGTSDFAGESKMDWIGLLAKPESNIFKIEKTLDEACTDAEHLQRHEGRRFGICFASVYLIEGHANKIDERLAKLQKLILKKIKYDALAWCFPPEVRDSYDPIKFRGSNYCYPGLFVILREVK